MLLALLLLPGLLIRAAVPAGFMPAVGQGAALTMAMCSGQAAQSVVMHPGNDPIPAHPDPRSPQHHEAPCVFAATAGGAPPPLPAVLVVAPTLPADEAHPVFAAPIARPAIRAHAPRAPPALV
jgi:Protein of unknown function (DUF2946)